MDAGVTIIFYNNKGHIRRKEYLDCSKYQKKCDDFDIEEGDDHIEVLFETEYDRFPKKEKTVILQRLLDSLKDKKEVDLKPEMYTLENIIDDDHNEIRNYLVSGALTYDEVGLQMKAIVDYWSPCALGSFSWVTRDEYSLKCTLDELERLINKDEDFKFIPPDKLNEWSDKLNRTLNTYFDNGIFS